ncbi:MAG TPA: hypothetical protein VFH61_15860 [Thermoleophilia bacterium]|nr:hypothetical protein [Thermoleophilia bacterium]
MILRFALFVLLFAIPAYAGDNYDEKPETIVCERGICPSLDALLESKLFGSLDCKQQTKACKAVASAEFKCEKALARAEAKTAAGACETKECKREVRSLYRETVKALRADAKSAKATCKAVCE